MRPSIRHLAVLVACLSAGVAVAAARRPADAASPAKAAAKRGPVQKEADAFLATLTGLLAPVSTSAALADWAAATDVTPEHVAQRTGADKGLAALIGATTVIDKTKALLKNEKQLDDLTVRQLRKLLLAAAENPGTIPEVVARRVELETKQSAILDGYTFCLQPKGDQLRQGRSPPTTSTTSCRSRAISTNASASGRRRRRSAGRSSRASIELHQAAQPGGARAGLPLVLRAPGRRLRHDRRRDDEAARRHAGDDEAALRRAALLGEEPARRALQAPGPEADPRPLGRQPLGADLAGAGRGRQPGSRCSRGRRPRPSSRAPRASTSRSASRSCRRRSGRGPTSTRCRPAWPARRTATPRPGTSTASATCAR